MKRVEFNEIIKFWYFAQYINGKIARITCRFLRVSFSFFFIFLYIGVIFFLAFRLLFLFHFLSNFELFLVLPFYFYFFAFLSGFDLLFSFACMQNKTFYLSDSILIFLLFVVVVNKIWFFAASMYVGPST